MTTISKVTKTTTKNLKRLVSGKHSRSTLFIAAFAIIGVIALVLTKAATPFASLESENGTPSNANIQTKSDPAASNGIYVQFGGITNPPADKPAYIFDTDWSEDVDDVVAARIVAYYHAKGDIQLLAATVNVTNAKGPGSLDAFLRYHKVDVPIGTASPDNGGFSAPYQDRMYDNYPHAVGLEPSVPPAVQVMRQALATSASRVDIISVGFLNNLSALLASPADGISGLTGTQLVQQKVGTLWVMGGRWPSADRPEYNFSANALARTSASAVAANWPTAIVFSGSEVGESVTTGQNLTTDYPGYILSDALSDHGSPYGRQSWDPMTTILAIIGDPAQAGYTTIKGWGVVNADTGYSTWTNDSNGRHFYTVKAQPDEFYTNQINALLPPPIQ